MPSGGLQAEPMTARLELDLADEAATRRLGTQLAALVRPGDVVALWGDLGSGKTTLARALIQALVGEDEEVPSPTFTLVQTYDGPEATLWHFDLYRLERPEDSLELGLEDALADGLVLIEWPERLGRLLPRRRLDLSLAPGASAEGRRAILAGGDEWTQRWGDLA
jgi:tRNA threonylcarbamoyladenosine biosynthesis protein TsaE